jgi:hypothetical protein
MVSGVSVEAFWTATYLWDLANYAIPSVAIVAAFAAFGLPHYTGRNLPAVAALFALFGLSSLPLTYALHFFFLDEMAALTWMLAGFFTWAFLSVTTNLMLQVRVASCLEHGLRHRRWHLPSHETLCFLRQYCARP